MARSRDKSDGKVGENDRFDTLTDFVDSLMDLKVTSNSQSWNAHAGGVTPAEAIRLAREGWPEGMAKAEELIGRVSDEVIQGRGMGEGEEVISDVMGAAYDPATFAAGIPECWGRIAPVVSKRAVRIVINVTTSYGVDPGDMMKRGLAVAALAMVLKAKGYPVTIDVAQYLYHSTRDRTEMTTVRVADANTGSPLDLDRIVFALAHPSMFRHLMRAHTDQVLGDTERGWGASNVLDFASQAKKDSDLYLTSMHLDHKRLWRKDPAGWVAKEVEAIVAGSRFED